MPLNEPSYGIAHTIPGQISRTPLTYSPPSVRRQHSARTIWLYWNALHIRKVLLLKQFCGQDQPAKVSVVMVMVNE